MRGEHRTAESRKEPTPDIERLFIDVLQLSQGHPNSITLFGNWVGQKNKTWFSQYSGTQLAQKTESQILHIVEGVSHLKIDKATEDIRIIARNDAMTFVDAISERLQCPSSRLLDAIIEGDFHALSGKGDNMTKLVGRGRRQKKAPKGMPITPLRDKYNSVFVYFVLMTPEERSRVHGQNYGLHPALEEMCTELREYYRGLRQKQSLSQEERWLLEDAQKLIAFWNKHHPHAQVSL